MSNTDKLIKWAFFFAYLSIGTSILTGILILFKIYMILSGRW